MGEKAWFHISNWTTLAYVQVPFVVGIRIGLVVIVIIFKGNMVELTYSFCARLFIHVRKNTYSIIYVLSHNGLVILIRLVKICKYYIFCCNIVESTLLYVFFSWQITKDSCWLLITFEYLCREVVTNPQISSINSQLRWKIVMLWTTEPCLLWSPMPFKVGWHLNIQTYK